MKDALIIFVRNPVLGKVKTRIAETLGDEAALKVYKFLLNHTRNITEKLPATKFVFYADEPSPDDLWKGYEKKAQEGNDLGQRMENAFKYLFETGYQNICIIGSDCYDLTEAILGESFRELSRKDIILGAAADGGYYLLGMKDSYKEMFDNIVWSSATVLQETLEKINKQQLSCHLLPVLNDVDTEKDITFHY